MALRIDPGDRQKLTEMRRDFDSRKGVTTVDVRKTPRSQYRTPPAADAVGIFVARITAVSGSFPVWTYTGQLILSVNTANTDHTRRVTDGVNITMKNGCEWTPASYPFIHGNGLRVQDSSGKVATTYAGGTAGTCIIRPIGVGAVVYVYTVYDQSGNLVYEFSMPNSAQK